MKVCMNWNQGDISNQHSAIADLEHPCALAISLNAKGCYKSAIGEC
jgi:hypothetical protein